MEFSYRFPAVKGVQANREYYIAMIPLKMISRLFPDDDEYVLPEQRAQRRLNESRIPVIRKYILENRSSYVFSALAASIDGEFNFLPIDSSPVGMLEVSMEAKFLINDGQHRKAAILEAISEDESLKDETISVVFYSDLGLERSQQMFTDLNKHAVKTSNSLATLYDVRDEIAVATKKVIDVVPFFKKYTDKERDNLGKNSCHLFTLNSIYKANQKIIHNDTCNPDDVDFLIEFWTCVSNNIDEWQEVLNKSLTKKDLRENYIVTLAVTINALGRLGRTFFDNRSLDFQKYISNLSNIDWLRSNDEWKHRIIRENGKIVNSEEASILLCSKIKQLIGLELSKEEKRKEKNFMEKYYGKQK